MKLKKITALLTAIALMLICTSCASIVIEVPEKYILPIFGNRAAVSGTETPAPQSSSAPVSEAASSVPSGGDTSEPASAPSADTGASTGTPTTKKEIIDYYVAAYNKIATDSKKIIRTYDYTSNYNNILNINGNSTLEKLANTLMNKFMVETTEPSEFSINDLPPLGVTTLSISEDQISEATCVDNGSSYTITLKSTGTDDNYELDAEPGKGSAGVIGPLLRTEDVSGAAEGFLTFEGLHAKYATCQLVATVDKATGHITALDFNDPCILHFDQVKVVVLKVENCDIGLLFQQKWTFEY